MSRSGPGRAGLAATFGHSGVAEAYRHRPPYPDEVFDVLESLITGRPLSRRSSEG